MSHDAQHLRNATQLDRSSDVVVITGMSGSGVAALHVFGDIGYYVSIIYLPSLSFSWCISLVSTPLRQASRVTGVYGARDF
jgi:RNase adaptor protein for sRNA GlmZ degradation